MFLAGLTTAALGPIPALLGHLRMLLLFCCTLEKREPKCMGLLKEAGDPLDPGVQPFRNPSPSMWKCSEQPKTMGGPWPKTMGLPWPHKLSLVKGSEDPWVQGHFWDSTGIYLRPFPHGNKTSVMLTAKANTVDQGSLQP